jgi:hypothetical protein
MKILIDDEFTDQARRRLEIGRHFSRGYLRYNPVTGTAFIHGEDPIVWQIRDAARALRARDRFAREHPDLPPLPLRYGERESAKSGPTAGGIEHALAVFGRSIEDDYDLDRHVSFDDYMRGFLCSPRVRKFFAPVADRFPPKPLPGLVPGHSYWGLPTRQGYIDELVTAETPDVPGWPLAWLAPEQKWQADFVAREQARYRGEGRTA